MNFGERSFILAAFFKQKTEPKFKPLNDGIIESPYIPKRKYSHMNHVDLILYALHQKKVNGRLHMIHIATFALGSSCSSSFRSLHFLWYSGSFCVSLSSD